MLTLLHNLYLFFYDAVQLLGSWIGLIGTIFVTVFFRVPLYFGSIVWNVVKGLSTLSTQAQNYYSTVLAPDMATSTFATVHTVVFSIPGVSLLSTLCISLLYATLFFFLIRFIIKTS